MNIDLLLSENDKCGLVCDEAFEANVVGVVFDAQAHMMALELANHDAIDLNIPIEESFSDILLFQPTIQVGVIADGRIEDARQVPLMYINDPYGGQMENRQKGSSATPLSEFERFIKKCERGQPLHRNDLDDDEFAGSVMGGMSPALLQFAPHLARQRNMEAAPTLQPDAPAPKGPGMSLGGGGGGGVARHTGGGHGGGHQSGNPYGDTEE